MTALAEPQDPYAPLDGLSHVKGRTDLPLWQKTIPALLAETVARHGAREACIFSETGLRWTYADLAAIADDLAAGLLALGLEKGDRIGIWAPNRPEWIALQYASAKIGLVLVNINPAYRLSELEYALNKVECKALLLADRFKTSDYLGMVRTLAPELADCAPGDLRSERLPHLRSVIRTGSETTPGMVNYDAVVAMATPDLRARADAIEATLQPDDPINIQFTSGTTGAPKGATLSHAGIVNNGRFVAHTMALTQDDRLCIPVPLYHCFGMVMGSLGCVSTGATMVFPAEAFEPTSTLQAVADEHCTALYGVPTMFVAMLQNPDFATFDCSTLRTGIMAGAPCPVEVMKQVVDAMNMREVTIAYGMTETSPVSFQSHTDDTLERRVSTVGRIHPHVEVKVIDETGAMVPVNVQGELCTRGYSVMRGYWNDDDRTAESIDANGWMHTGDLGVIDDAGYGNIVGRVKDMVIRGGENVYPREVEEYLFRHPKVQEVQVFGVPDDKYGEELCAWIVLKEGETAQEEEIKAFCRDQIAHYKIPRYIRFKDVLPMTVTGKPQKFLMREAMVAELGLAEAETA